MNHLTFGLLGMMVTAQAGNRPEFAVVAQDSAFVHLMLSWQPALDRRGDRYPSYEWEARDRNDLLANGTTEGLMDTVLVLRPDAGDTLWVRGFVRGIDAGGRPGGWGWASIALMITDQSAESAPEGPPAPGAEPQPAPGAEPPAPGAEPPPAPGAEPPPPPEPAAVAVADPPSAADSQATVSLPAAPPRAPPTMRGGGHEPDNYTTIVARRFDSRAADDGDRGAGSLPYRTGGSEGFDGAEHRSRALSIEADEDAPLSPPNVLLITYRGGFAGGTAPAAIQTQQAGWTSPTDLYLQYAFKVSPEFFGHATTTNKVFHFWVGGNRIFDRLVGSGSGPLQYQVAKQGGEPPCQSAKPRPSDTRLRPNRGDGTIVRGRWYVVEMQLILNTPGRCDGTVRVWLDGRQIIDYQNVGIRRADESRLRWEQVQLSPTWGGRGGNTPRAFTLAVDHIYISGR